MKETISPPATSRAEPDVTTLPGAAEAGSHRAVVAVRNMEQGSDPVRSRARPGRQPGSHLGSRQRRWGGRWASFWASLWPSPWQRSRAWTGPGQRLMGSESGMATAEYAITTLAAVGLAGLLVVILRSEEVRGFLLNVIRTALSLP